MTPCSPCRCAPVESVVIAGFAYLGLECTTCGSRSFVSNAPRSVADETALGAFALWLCGDAAGIGYDDKIGVFCCEIEPDEEPSVPPIERGHLRLATMNQEPV